MVTPGALGPPPAPLSDATVVDMSVDVRDVVYRRNWAPNYLGFHSLQPHHGDGGTSGFFKDFPYAGIWGNLHFSWEFHLWLGLSISCWDFDL